MSKSENREIVAFKLKDESFRKAAEAVVGRTFGTYLSTKNRAIMIFEEAQVLDVWFEPVYKDTPTQEKPKPSTWYVSKNNSNIIFYHKGNYQCFGVHPETEQWHFRFKITDFDTENYIEVNPYSGPLRLLMSEVNKRHFIIGGYLYRNASGHIDRIVSIFMEGTSIKVKTTTDVMTIMENGTWASSITPTPHIKDNTWYKSSDNEILFHTQAGEGYGITPQGKWFNDTDKKNAIFTRPSKYKELSKNETLLRIYGYAVAKGYLKGDSQDIIQEDVSTFSKLIMRGGVGKDIKLPLLKDGEWTRVAHLPRINGCEGNMDKENGNNLIYGCAKIRPEWFCSSENRHITQLTLSSGVTINQQQIKEIREFLKQDEKFMRFVNMRKETISMDDMGYTK